MTDDEDPYDDPVAEALVGGSVYERLRVTRVGSFTQSIPRKLRWKSGLLFALALTLPLFAVMPADVRSLLPPGDPLAGSPKIIVLGLVGGAATFLAGLCLLAVLCARVRAADGMSEHRAETLLSLEEVASLVGFVTGGPAIAITLGFVLLGLGGGAAIETYVQVTGRNPFAGTSTVSVSQVATLSFAGSVALFVASQLATQTLALGVEGNAGPDRSAEGTGADDRDP